MVLKESLGDDGHDSRSRAVGAPEMLKVRACAAGGEGRYQRVPSLGGPVTRDPANSSIRGVGAPVGVGAGAVLVHGVPTNVCLHSAGSPSG